MTKDIIINDLIDKNHQFSSLIIHNTQNISMQELEEVFNTVVKVQENLFAIIGFQYIINPVEPLKDNENVSFNLRVMICTIFQYIIERMNKILYSLTYRLLVTYQFMIYDYCKSSPSNFFLSKLVFVDKYKDTLQLQDIYINTDHDKHILYEVKHKDNIKEYFQELIDNNTFRIVKQYLSKLCEYKENANKTINQIITDYKNVKYTDFQIGCIFVFNNELMRNSSYFSDSFFLLYKDCSTDTLNKIFNKLTYCGLDLKWLINASFIVKDIKTISDKLNQKTYIPNFQRNNSFDLSTGNIGLGKYTVQHHKDLINGFNKIRASIELNDYPLQQIIIHSRAYVINIGTLSCEDIRYTVFICRYFNKIKIKITNYNNEQVSVRSKRKLLVNKHVKKLLIDIHKTYFTPDETLMKNVKTFLEKGN